MAFEHHNCNLYAIPSINMACKWTLHILEVPLLYFMVGLFVCCEAALLQHSSHLRHWNNKQYKVSRQTLASLLCWLALLLVGGTNLFELRDKFVQRRGNLHLLIV